MTLVTLVTLVCTTLRGTGPCPTSTPCLRSWRLGGTRSLGSSRCRPLLAHHVPAYSTFRLRPALPPRLQARPRGIVFTRKASPYRSGRPPDWLKMKNPDAPAVKREAKEEWHR